MRFDLLAEYCWGDVVLQFLRDQTQPERIGLRLLPKTCAARVVPPRTALTGAPIDDLPRAWLPLPAGAVEPLVHVHVRGDPLPSGYAAGRTLRNSGSTSQLRLVEHAAESPASGHACVTVLRDARGLEVTHRLACDADARVIGCSTEVANRGNVPLTLELITSFTLGGITPFAARDEPGRLIVHRFRSAWSAEGRHEARSLEELHLERSWSGHGVRLERIGQVGSLPVNGFFPCVGVEDRVAGVTWAARLAHPGSWQIELARSGDPLAISGGLADQEFGHWSKDLAPGETFSAPAAQLTVVDGDIDSACDRLTRSTLPGTSPVPAVERTFPIVFNEWCTSWGNPGHDNLVTLADRLRGSGVRYLVIDDGWAERPGCGFQQNGDWIVNGRAFPQGLRATAEAIRARGLIPGLWFEFEAVNPGSRAWDEVDHQLRRDGHVIQVGPRRFWDFRDPWVHAFLEARVIGTLRDAGIGYLKVDYNDSIGVGCDGAESLGEGLRQHLVGVQRLLATLRAALPELVIENCSSGGHRLEPSMMALTSMSSFSDAHETPDIPIIAANLRRLTPAAATQIWCVLHPGDTPWRISYSLAATFLGRMCLSGDVHRRDVAQWRQVAGATARYQAVAPVISEGVWRRFGERNDAYQHPRGWQAMRCTDEAGGRALVVWHAFADAPVAVAVPLPAGRWSVVGEVSPESVQPAIAGDRLSWRLPAAWTGGVIELARRP